MPAEDFDGSYVVEARPPSRDGLFVRFYTRQVRNKTKSLAEGRPIHDPTEYVEIHMLGDKTNIIDRPVEPQDKQKYSAIYEAFLKGKEQGTVGQPLKDWPPLPENLAEDWSHLGIRTVEDLAAIPEQALSRLGPLARGYQAKAQKYIEAAKMDAPIMQLQEELEKERAARKELERVVASLTSEIRGESMAPPVDGAVPMPAGVSAMYPPKRRGRPPKAVTETR